MTWLKRFLAAILAAFRSPDPANSGGGSSPPDVPDNPAPPTPDARPGDFDLAKVIWVHGAGQNIASWPILCALAKVEFVKPYFVRSTGAAWPASWPKLGAKGVQANHVVIAFINGQWWGGAWEALNLRAAREDRPLETIKNGQSDKWGPFGQVERDPFWMWRPVKGEAIGFMVTSWVRSYVAQPVGRSKVVWATWP